MADAGAEALASLHLIRATMRALANRKILVTEEVREVIDDAIDKCTKAGPTILRNQEASGLMEQIRDDDYGQ